MSALYGWHFVGEYSRGGVDEIGVMRTEPAARVGKCGLHFSPCALEALRYAKAPTLQRVRASGVIVVEDDGALGGRYNHAATERTALATLPGDVVGSVIRAWLFRCIENHARPALVRSLRHAASQDSNPERSAIATRHADAIEALSPVVDEASCEAFRAAADAATWAATWAATRAATRNATWAATWAATRDATWDATWAATRDATWDATWAATWAATRNATWAATWAATRDATWDATWDAVTSDLNDALMAALAERGYDASTETQEGK